MQFASLAITDFHLTLNIFLNAFWRQWKNRTKPGWGITIGVITIGVSCHHTRTMLMIEFCVNRQQLFPSQWSASFPVWSSHAPASDGDDGDPSAPATDMRMNPTWFWLTLSLASSLLYPFILLPSTPLFKTMNVMLDFSSKAAWFPTKELWFQNIVFSMCVCVETLSAASWGNGSCKTSIGGSCSRRMRRRGGLPRKTLVTPRNIFCPRQPLPCPENFRGRWLTGIPAPSEPRCPASEIGRACPAAVSFVLQYFPFLYPFFPRPSEEG